MAQIDIFLDIDEVLKGIVFADGPMRKTVFAGSVRRLNNLIRHLQNQDHRVTIVPVTSHRTTVNARQLRQEFLDLGLMAGLPFEVHRFHSRAEVVAMRLSRGKTDAYVIFDDNKSAYPADEPHVVEVNMRANDSINDFYRGISGANIDTAKMHLIEQLNQKGLPYRRGTVSQSAPRQNGPDDGP